MLREASSNYRSWMIGILLVAFTVFQALFAPKQQSDPTLTIQQASYHLPASIQTQLSLGYNNLIAVFQWFSFINEFGAKDVADQSIPHLIQQLTKITNSNPKNPAPYYVAATVIPWQAQTARPSEPLLIKAMIEFPDDWQWSYYRGFNAYWFDHNIAQASRLLELSARKQNAPPIVLSLALRMKAKSNQIDSAIMFLQSLIRQHNDPKVQKQFIQQMQLLQTEKVLRQIDQALHTLPRRSFTPDDLVRLQQKNYPLPTTLPDGGEIVMDHNGNIFSSKHPKRFTIFTHAKKNGSHP